MKPKREYAFDILRIISMFMVIVIHVSNVYSRRYGLISTNDFLGSLVYNTVCRVSVPIFLMISGALLLDRKFEKEKYLKRILKFIIIIIVWDAIYLLWEYLYLGKTHDKLYRLLWDPYRAHLWYLYTLVLLYFLQPALKWILEKLPKKAKWILLILWLALSTYSIFNHKVSMYFTQFSYIGYFILGKYLYDWIKKHVTKDHNYIEAGIIIVCMMMSIMLNFKASLEYDMFYKSYFAYRTPFIMLPSFAFYAYVITNFKKQTISKLTAMLSEVSLGVYLIHGIFLDIIVHELMPYLKCTTFITIPICAIIIFILSITSVYLLRKIKPLQRIL